MIQLLYPLSWGRMRLLIFVLLSSLSSYLHAQNGSVTTTQSFSYTGQIVTWTVPSGVTSLTIEARGAEGGDYTGSVVKAGKGAIVAAQIGVTPGQSLSILVGQSLNGRSAGGGGSFVVAPPSSTTAPTPLVIAGGGGGATTNNQATLTKHGQATQNGGAGSNGGGAGGTNGAGGNTTNGSPGGAGGGFLGNGQDISGYANSGGRAFVNGGSGGQNPSGTGGYGGGGSAGLGWGGGSYITGSQLFIRTGAADGNSGNGLVTISYVAPTYPTRYVKATASGTGDGSSWANASSDLQAMINATGVQQVWVAGGIYKPGPVGNTDRTISFNMKNGVAIFGGFAGSENSLGDRPAVNPVTGPDGIAHPSSTTLSGDIGTPGNTADNSYRVVANVNSGLDNKAMLDGFVITGGNGGNSGGGIHNDRCSPTLANLLFTANSAGAGGALSNERYSNTTLLNCIITNNSATQGGGGGIFNDTGSDTQLTNCTLNSNSAADGGGIYNSTQASCRLIDCRLTNNTAGRKGGGVFSMTNGTNITLSSCVLIDNSAADGGGIYMDSGLSIFTNCLIEANRATGQGGGLYIKYQPAGSSLTNCLLRGNSAGQGGALFSYAFNPKLTNCTISDNSAEQGGALYNDFRSIVTLTNSVIWHNQSSTSVANTFINRDGSSINASYNLLESGVTNYTSGEGNRTANISPFASDTDYRLAPSSQAIDAGDPASSTATSGVTDLGNNPRIANNRIDIGAFEFQGPFCQPVAITQQPVSGSSVCVGSTATAIVSVTGTNPTYQWYKDGTSLGTAQQSATLTLTNVQTNQSGSYSVVVTGSCNSVTSTAFSLTVNAPPVATLTASPSTILSCAQTSLTLTAGSGTSYAFSGPGIVSQGGNQAVVNTSGTYSVTVTSSGCTSITSIAISQDNTSPTATLSNYGPLSCSATSVTLTASGGTSYRFSAGATQIGNGPTATVTTAGVYSVTVLSGNGCSSVASTTVTGDQAAPTVNVTPTSGTLTCASPNLTLTANTSAPTLRWSNGQTTPSITVNAAGTYSVTATGANGCSATSNPVVVESSQTPPPATLLANGTLSCAVNSVTLTANTGDGLSYRFSSGATQVGNGNTATVNVAGTYSVTVTNTATGCTNTASIVVNQDNSQPTVTVNPTSASLTCGVPSVTLTATTSAPSIRWSTGQTTASISASVAGTYSVTVTSANGCMAMAQATVSGTTEAPAVPTLSANPATTTTNQPIVVTASGCAGGMINWALSGGTGQAGLTSFTLTQPGNYSLSASCTLNGCTSPYSPLLALQIRPGGFAITGVNMVNCQLTNPARGEYQVQFTPQYTGQTSNPISFAVVNELAPTTAPAPYSLRLYTDNPVVTLVATQAGNGEARFAYNWLASCQSGTSPNQPPTTTGIPSQTIVQGQGYQLQLTSYFSDPDGQALSFQASGLPAGLSLSGSVISGTPSQTGVSSINVTAIDPGGLPVSASFQLTVNPMPVTPPTGFAIVGVSTVSCQVLSAGERRLTFTPQYGGVNGTPISFSVVNELVATTNPGPYSLNLYTDNPSITLSAQQGATVSTYRYNWLAVCTPAARVGSGEVGSRLQVRVLGNPVAGNTAEVEISGVTGQSVQLNLVDMQGKSVHTQRIEQAGAVERVSLPMGASNGVLLLQVSTSTQRQQLKLLRTN